MIVTNWGRYPRIDATMRAFHSQNELRGMLEQGGQIIPRGLGRCYGDSALNDQIISTVRYDRMLSFDEMSGELTVECGVSLQSILETFVPRGWFLPVTPGTKFVTVGGAIASDVHGKNHHRAGSISRHIPRLKIMLADGTVRTITPRDELFRATCGGMGLTGMILEASIRLMRIPTAYIRQETVKARNLSEIMSVFESSGDWTYSVAWIDCLSDGSTRGRSIMMRGEHARLDEITTHYPLRLPPRRTLSIPVDFPSFSLNSLSVRAFNELYYRKAHAGIHSSIVDYDSFFYPLDSILQWNRIYGKRGFTQYQFVLPREVSAKGLELILTRIARSGQGSFLAVLKLFGPQDSSFISFPREGYTLALDFRIRRGLLELLEELDRIVIDHGGRLYLTKDVRMSRETFEAGYEHADDFRELKHRYDAANRFQSLQSKRTGV